MGQPRRKMLASGLLLAAVEALKEDKTTAAFIKTDGTMAFLKRNVMRRYGTTKNGMKL